MTRRQAFDQAVAAVNTWFEQNFGPGTDGEGMTAQIRMDPPGGDRIFSDLMDATVALYASMGHPITMPARRRDGSNFQARLAAFNSWLGERLGVERAADAPLRAEELRAASAGQMNFFSVVSYDADGATTVATATDALGLLADRRAASPPPQSITVAVVPSHTSSPSRVMTPPQPTAPPQVISTPPRVDTTPAPPPVVPTAPQQEVTTAPPSPHVTTASRPPPTVTEPPQPLSSLEVTSLGEQVRLQGRLEDAIRIGRETLTLITGSMSGTGAFPRELATRLQTELSGRVRRAQSYLDGNRGNLSTEYVEDAYTGLARFSETASMILRAWSYSRRRLPTEEVARGRILSSFRLAVSTLTDSNFNPFQGYDSQLREQLARAYSTSVGTISSSAGLATALTTLAGRDGTPQTIVIEATALAAALRSGTPPEGQTMTDVRRRGNELIVEGDLLRSWDVRYDAAEYQAYRGIWNLAPPLGAEQERAATAMGSFWGELNRMIYYYTDVVVRVTPRLDSQDLTRTPEARRLRLARTRLEESQRLLNEAIAVAVAQGLTSNVVLTRTVDGTEVRIEAGQALVQCRALATRAEELLQGLTGSVEDVTTARALANRMFYAGAGLMGIGAAMTMYNERATFSSAGEPWQDLAFTRLSSSLYYFNAAFGHVEDESTYYPAMALVLALGSVEALAPEAMRVLATADRFNSMMPVATRVSESRLIAQLTMDLEEAEDVEENREYIEGLRADLQEAQDVLRDFNSSYQERVRQQVERETHFFRLVADMRTDDTFGDSPALTRGTESGYILADSLLDPRFRRMEIPTMSTRVDPFVTPLDTNTDQQIRPHRRIAEHFIDRAGHVFGELERQARIRQDTTAPDVLRTDLPHLNLTEFQQLDLNALQTAMQEMSEAYGSAVPYAQVTAMGNRILMQVLDGRIEQLQLLLERTRRPPADQAQQRRYYDIAQRALRDARSLRRAFGNTTSTAQMSRDMFSRRIFEGSPTEAIAMAELGLVQLSRVTGFGTHAPAAVPDFRRFLTGRARASILAAHPDQYRITLPVHALTSEGMMPLEEFDTRLQRAGQPPVPRDVHFLLFESIPGSPNRHLLRNPRYTEGGTEPEYIGIADTSTGIVYAARRAEDEVGGDVWVPRRRAGGGERDYVVLFNIRADLTPVFNDAYRELQSSGDVPYYRWPTTTMFIPRQGPVPTPVGYIDRRVRQEEQ